MDLNKLEKMPAALFTDVTAQPDEPRNNHTDADESAGANGAFESEDAVMQTGSHANINEFNSDATPRQFPTPDGGNSFAPQGTAAGKLVSGKTATELMDSVFPALSVYLFSYMGYNLRKAELQLSADEKKTIAPVMQEYLNTLTINLNNPLYNLLFVVGAIYGAKIIEKLPTIEKKTARAVKNSVVKETLGAPVSDRENLIKNAMKERKKGRADAIRYLGKTGQLKD